MLTRAQFARRVARHGGLGSAGVAVALGLGMCGYHYIVGFQWIDSLVEASMILGGMGPVKDLPDSAAAKFFVSGYALFAGLFFIVMIGLLLAPFLHRLAHHFHLDKK